MPLDCREVRVPALILQPLVENAIVHGIAPHVRGGRVTIRARLDGELLELLVEDQPTQQLSVAHARDPAPDGVGLASTRERLVLAFGDAGRLEHETTSSGGTLVRLSLPASEAAS